jgi:hypothetical protein
MKTQIRGKTRNQGFDWAVFRRPDEKTAAGGLVGFMAGDAPISVALWEATSELERNFAQILLPS